MFNLMYPLKYVGVIKNEAEEYGLDESLVSAIIFTESKFKKNAFSNKGAVGLMQIMPATAKSFYDKENVFFDKLLYDPEVNIEIGCKFLKYLFDKYEDKLTVLACYNAGEKNVLLWKGDNKYLEKAQIQFKETLKYVEKVQKCEKIYKIKLGL